MGGHRCAPAAALALALLTTCCLPESAPGVGGASGTAQPAGLAPGAALVLPLPRRGPPVVDVVVTGYGPARFLVDTGGQFTWIDRDFVRRHSIPTEPIEVNLTDATGRTARVREAAVLQALELAGTPLTGLRPMVLDAIHRGVDGAIGQDCLRSFLTVFDGPGERLVLLYGDQRLDDHPTAFTQLGAIHVHDADYSTGIPRVPLHVPTLGQALSFVFDTGSEHNTLPPEVIAALEPRRVGTFASRGLAGPGPMVGLYEVERLQVGELLLSGLVTETPNPSLGWDTLRTTVTVFENATNTILVLPNARVSAGWPGG